MTAPFTGKTNQVIKGSNMRLSEFGMPFSQPSGYVKQERERLNVSWHESRKNSWEKEDLLLKSGLNSNEYGRNFSAFPPEEIKLEKT